MVALVRSIKDLKGAKYNPRYITDKQLEELQSSVKKYGDLSGIVFNVKSGVLVSGHQRMKTIEPFKTKVVAEKVKNGDHGTVAIGHIEAETDQGIVKFPYREVNWSDQLTEMAANVAANSAGGDFDQAKLGYVLAKLEKGKFPVEFIPMDKWTIGKAIGKYKKSGMEGSADVKGNARIDKFSASDEEMSEFESVNTKAMRFAHECPKCGFKFGDPGKAASGVKQMNAVAKTTKTTKAKVQPPLKAKTAPIKNKTVRNSKAKPVPAKKAASKR